MRDGYIRVAAASFHTTIANVTKNTQAMLPIIGQVYENQTKIVVFPELCLTGYSCQDLFFQNTLLEESKVGLQRLIKHSKGKDIIIVVGLPYQHKNKLYNVAAIIHDNQLLALVPKTHIPNYQEFYERRHFAPAPDDNTYSMWQGQKVPFGKQYIFSSKSDQTYTFGVEICEDLWLPNAPSNRLALEGANLILNPSASDEVTTKADYRRLLIQSQSARLICGYVYSNAGYGESTTDIVFSGHHIIGENGTIIKESPGFTNSIIYGDFDLQKLTSERRKLSTYNTINTYETIYFDSQDIDLDTNYFYTPHPFVPSNPDVRSIRCQEVFNIQKHGLMQRLEATGIKKIVIGVSGGLDSTLALLVCKQAFDALHLPSENIVAITMPCFGTTKRTKNNALLLMEELQVTSLTIDITNSVKQQFKDLEQDENLHDVTYENVQARARTAILMNKANQVNGLVIGTGDLSEVALGWSTYNGDHMSMYAVNVSVPKTLVRYLVDYVATLYPNTTLERVLKDVLDTPVSPELLPAKKNEIVQKTEDIVGPYELHDFFLYHFIRFGDKPRKLFKKTKLAFGDTYDNETIKKWMQVFYRRFFTQQFKRSCIPDGPKVGTVSLSPRGDWRMPSDANVEMWLNEIKEI